MDKENHKKDSLPVQYVLIGGAVLFVAVCVVIFVITNGKVGMALNNIRSYYGGMDEGLFLNEQEAIIKRAVLLDNVLIIGLIAVVLAVVLYRLLKGSMPLPAKSDSTEEQRRKAPEVKLNESLNDIQKISEQVTESFAEKMKRKSIQYTVELDDVEKPQVICDAELIKKVFEEQLDNAYESAPEEGHVYAALKQFFVSDDGYGHYEFTVEDDGIGRSDHTISDTGHIVDAMDGYVDIDEQPGVGTGVTVSFKLKVAKGE